MLVTERKTEVKVKMIETITDTVIVIESETVTLTL